MYKCGADTTWRSLSAISQVYVWYWYHLKRQSVSLIYRIMRGSSW